MEFYSFLPYTRVFKVAGYRVADIWGIKCFPGTRIKWKLEGVAALYSGCMSVLPKCLKGKSHLLLCFIPVVCCSSECALAHFFSLQSWEELSVKILPSLIKAKVSELRISTYEVTQINHLKIWNMCLGKEEEECQCWIIEFEWCLWSCNSYQYLVNWNKSLSKWNPSVGLLGK